MGRLPITVATSWHSPAQHAATLQDAGGAGVGCLQELRGQGREHLSYLREAWVGMTGDCY